MSVIFCILGLPLERDLRQMRRVSEAVGYQSPSSPRFVGCILRRSRKVKEGFGCSSPSSVYSVEFSLVRLRKVIMCRFQLLSSVRFTGFVICRLRKVRESVGRQSPNLLRFLGAFFIGSGRGRCQSGLQGSHH